MFSAEREFGKDVIRGRSWGREGAMVIALAGRRIDAVGAKPERFPVRNIDEVRKRVRALLESMGAAAVVDSAACGADLIGQTEAGAMGLRRRIVLPFARKRFRKTSVVDLPGDWGEVYDGVIEQVEDVVVLPEVPAGEEYGAVNRAILDEAAKLARELGQEAVAVVVWEGAPRGERDWTADFRQGAKKRGWRVMEVQTTSVPP